MKEPKAKETKANDSIPSTATPSPQKHVHFPRDKTDEIAHLIYKLGKMNINDSNCMPTYFRIITYALQMAPFLVSLPQNIKMEVVLTPYYPHQAQASNHPCPLSLVQLNVISVEKRDMVRDNVDRLRT